MHSMSSECYTNENVKIINSLIDFSENAKYDDVSKYKNNVNDNWNEAVTPWKAIVSHPRYYPYQVSVVIKRKSKQVDTRVPEWQRTNLVDGESKQVVRCVNDELDNGPYVYWKGMVEQVTYRYVPHNGYYRTMKFLSFDNKEWFTVNKKQPEQVSMSWQSKRYQKELKRQLKRDFENQNKKENDCKEATKFEETEERNELAVETLEKREVSTDQRRKRAKSTRLSVISPRLQKDEDGYLVPEIQSAPLPGDLYKSRSDLYFENFSFRISALEQEIANDTKIRKNQDDTIKTFFRPKVKEKGKEKDVTPRPYKKESLPEDVFTAKSIGSKEIKSSEKLTPISRMSTADSKSSPVTHLKYTNNSGNDSGSANLPTLDLDRTLNSYKLAIETTRQSLLSTLNGKQISRRTTISSKNYNGPTTITICDSGNTSDKEAIQEFIRPLKGEKRVRDKKESVNGVTTLLPEIAGKRLQVSTTSHRWL